MAPLIRIHISYANSYSLFHICISFANLYQLLLHVTISFVLNYFHVCRDMWAAGVGVSEQITEASAELAIEKLPHRRRQRLLGQRKTGEENQHGNWKQIAL